MLIGSDYSLRLSFLGNPDPSEILNPRPIHLVIENALRLMKAVIVMGSDQIGWTEWAQGLISQCN